MASPCAACKYLRRRCTQDCVFAPYFPPDQPQKFIYVHKIFGASNVGKILNQLPSDQREDAVNSLFYEAESRLLDPVYGCVGLISLLQHQLKQIQHGTENARQELAAYIGPQAMLPILQTQHHPQPHFMFLPPQPQQPPSSSSASVLTQQHHHNSLPMMANPTGQLYHQQPQQIYEPQHLAAVDAIARDQQNEMFRAFGGGGSNGPHHHQNPQDDILRFNNAFDSVPTGSVTVTGFNQVSLGGTTVTGMSPSLALGGNFVGSPPTNDTYHTDQQLQHHHHQQEHHEAQLFIPTQSSQPLPLQTQETQTQPNTESEEGRRRIGLSW